jgi:hypothetical protein
VNLEPMFKARLWPSPAAKLTPEEVAAIRTEAGRFGQTTLAEVARRYNVHESTISRIWSGKAWRLEATS